MGRQLESFRHMAPPRVALLLVDFQNDFCSPTVFGEARPTNTLNAITAHRANEFARRASALGIHVIYSRQVIDLSKLTIRQRQWKRQDPGYETYNRAVRDYLRITHGAVETADALLEEWTND